MKEFNITFSDVDDMELETLLDFIFVYDKINDTTTKDKKGATTYKVLD